MKPESTPFLKLAELIASAALEGCEKEYSKKTVKDRSSRVQARRDMIQRRGAAAVKGKDIEHKDGNPRNNSPSNLTLRSRAANRSDNGHRKGEPYAKAKKGITNTYKRAMALPGVLFRLATKFGGNNDS